MIRFGEARKRDVVTTNDAETVGRIDHFVVDPETRRIAAVRLDKVQGDDRYVSWSRIGSFGQDVVTIEDAAALRKPDGPREEGVRKEFAILGKRVLSDAGRELGEVTDVEFDQSTGAITALLTEREQIAGERLRGIGSYAVVVARDRPAGEQA